MVSRQALTNFLYGKISAHPLDAADRLLAQIPISFDPSIWELLVPWCCGATAVLAAPGGERDSGYLVRLAQDWKITHLHMVTSRLALLLEHPHFKDCASLSAIFCGGESMPPDLPEKLHQTLPLKLLNSYGPTETCISATTCQLVPGEIHSPDPIGRPNANLQIYILDQELQPVPEGVAGELYIAGQGLARGYLNQPAQTAERFIPNPFGPSGSRLYRTGDLGCYQADGQIEFLGRIDNQVKLRGNRIELGEIEHALEYHPQVRQAALLLRQAENGTRLSACVVLQAGEHTDGTTLRSYLSQRLPEYMLPADFCFLDSLPLQPSGKIDRLRLLNLDFLAHDQPAAYLPPRTRLEKELAEIFAQTLELEKVGLRDDFFELGGHSLLVMRCLVKIHQRFELELPMRTLFDAPTVEQLAVVISGLSSV
jgi:nonribosomal peptide synthetase DhbF